MFNKMENSELRSGNIAGNRLISKKHKFCSDMRNENSSRINISRAFTLIELLMVISIIAILSSILLPVLSKAKDKAREVECNGNMKQIGQMQSLYNADYDSWYVMCYGNEYGNYWSNILYSLYRSQDGLIFTGIDTGDTERDKYEDYLQFCSSGNKYETGTVFHCPSQNSSYYPTNNDIKEYPVSYAMCSTLGNKSSQYCYRWRRLTMVKYPSEAMLITDCGFTKPWIDCIAYWRDWSPLPASTSIHMNRRNILFSDGHSSSMRSIDFPRLSEYRGSFWTGSDKTD